MSGPIDPRSLAPYSGGPIRLGLGLDQSSPVGLTQPGSLRQCCNFEVVDGYLQFLKGNMVMGGHLLNGRYGMYMLVGSSATDYTLTGSIVDGEVVSWYADSVSMNDKIGEGIWYEENVPSNKAWVGIIHTSGKAPTGQLYFVSAGGATLTVTSDDYAFSLPNDGFTALTAPYASDAALLAAYTGYGTIQTWDAFRPYPLQTATDDAGMSHIFQCNDNLYAVTDFYVARFFSGVAEPDIGDKIHIDYPTGNITAYVAHVEITSGTWEGSDAAGWLYLYPQSDSTLSHSTLDNILTRNNDLIYNVTQSVNLGYTPPQTGNYDITVHKSHGLVWKLDTSTQINTGWKFIHPGYSVRLANDDTSVDQKAPSTEIAPLFTTDALNTLADTGYLAFNTPTEIGGGTLAAWSTLTNLVSDDAAYASATPLAGNGTKKLNFSLAASTAIPDTAKITGVEVIFEAQAAATDVVYVSTAQLRNSAATNDFVNRAWATSENRGRSIEDPLTASPTVFTIGGQLDMWGLEEIPLADWNSQDISLDLQFWNTDASSRQVDVDYVWIKVYYTVNSKHLYFVRDGSDITEGTAFAYQVLDGEWSTDDATGWLTFDSIDDPGAVLAGDAIWTGTGGTGSFIGNVRALQTNLLPSYAEMRDAGTRPRTVISSLASEDGEETAFCVNGVGPAWALDASDRVRMIRTPVSPEKDKPRYVEDHRNHLMLALKEHVVVSALASPDVMSTYDGATTWHVRDRISGLHHTTDGTTVILCRDSIHQFQGASASGGDSFTLSTITNRGGAKDYSSVEMGDVYFLTSGGLSSVGATDKFGNFDAALLSNGVDEWLRSRLITNNNSTGEVADRGFLDCMPVRSKNQIRFYFKDGWILTATIDTGGGPPQFTTQNYALRWQGGTGVEGGSDWLSMVPDGPAYLPTALHSSFTSWGEERLYFGFINGSSAVMRLDTGARVTQANSSSLTARILYGYAELNPVLYGYERDAPAQLKRTSLIFDCPARPDVYLFVGSDFEAPRIEDSTTAGSAPYQIAQEDASGETSAFTGSRLPFIATSHIGNYSYAHAWTIVTSTVYANFDQPMRVLSVMPEVQLRKPSARSSTATDLGTSLPRKR